MLAAYRFPFAPFAELRREMDHLFEEFGLRGARGPFPVGAFPALNVWDAGEALCVEAEVPGVRQRGLEIFVVGNELMLKGRRPESNGENHTYHRQERGTGEFSRVITLPAEVDSHRVEAALQDSVLTITLPKQPGA